MGVEVFATKDGGAEVKVSLDFDNDGMHTLQRLFGWMSEYVSGVGREVIGQELKKGFDPQHVVVVDGVAGKPIESVKPFGKIEVFERMTQADVTTELLSVYDLILKNSPVDTGLYKAENVVVFNGRVVADTRQELETFAKTTIFKENDILRFVNATPYARKLERYGITASRSKTRYKTSRNKKTPGRLVLTPNGTYFLAYRATRRKFEKIGNKVGFEFFPGNQLGITTPLHGPKGVMRLNYVPENSGRPYLYPTIKIVFRGTTIR